MEAGKGRRVQGAKRRDRGRRQERGDTGRGGGGIQEAAAKSSVTLVLSCITAGHLGKDGILVESRCPGSSRWLCISRPDSPGCVQCVLALFTDPSPDQAEAPQAG